MKNIDKVYGCIYKKEFVTTVEKNILPGSFVLKIWKPFHGLQDKMPLRNLPDFYFMVMKEDYPLDDIIMASEKIKLKSDKLFDAVEGNIYLAGETHPVIRIKLFDKSLLIKDIQNLFIEFGFEMAVNRAMIKERGVIKLKKYFSLEEAGEGIYFDIITPELAYFRLPLQVDWDLFEEITKRIAVNVALGDFDTALGAFHIDEKTEYIIRVLKLQRSLDSIELIKQDYLTYVNKPELLNLNAV
jgi:hypothetical protein